MLTKINSTVFKKSRERKHILKEKGLVVKRICEDCKSRTEQTQKYIIKSRCGTSRERSKELFC